MLLSSSRRTVCPALFLPPIWAAGFARGLAELRRNVIVTGCTGSTRTAIYGGRAGYPHRDSQRGYPVGRLHTSAPNRRSFSSATFCK